MKKSMLATYVRMYGLLRYIMKQNEAGIHPKKEEIQQHCSSYEIDGSGPIHSSTISDYMNEISRQLGIMFLYDDDYGYYIDNLEEWIKDNKFLIYWLDTLWLHNITDIKGELSDVIEFEPLPDGVHFVPDVLMAIWNHHPVNIEYQKLGENEKKHYNVEPLGIRQFGNRYYLTTLPADETENKNLAFHAMQKVEIAYNETMPARDFSIKEYYSDFHGTWADKSRPAIDIKIRAMKPYWAKFLLNPKFHHSIREVGTSADGKMTDFIIHIVPMPDFVQTLMRYSPYIVVLEPPTLKDYMMKMLNASIDAYASPDKPLPDSSFPDRF